MLHAAAVSPGHEECNALLLTGWVRYTLLRGVAQHSHDPGGTRLLLE
ncbi:hypothetical protein ABZW32_34790 [Streptomyces sp. NPDC004667]